MSWNDMPIIYEGYFECAHCRAITKHHCAAYKDVEYRTCTRCQTRTSWAPDPTRLTKTDESTPDPRHADDDRKRGRDHGKWSKRPPKK